MNSFLTGLAGASARLIGVLLGAVVAVIVAGFLVITGFQGWYESRREEWQLARMPAFLQVTGMTYSNEVSEGPGPGANETGLAVYGLPDAIATEIADKGLDFFARPETPWKGWRPTPVERDQSWSVDFRTAPAAAPPDLADYLDEYGRPLDVPPRLAAQIDHAIQAPGSYYAYGRAGSLLIVAPAARQAYLLYRG